MPDDLTAKTESAVEKIKQEGFVFRNTILGIDNYRKPLSDGPGYEYISVKDGKILERFKDRW